MDSVVWEECKEKRKWNDLLFLAIGGNEKDLSKVCHPQSSCLTWNPSNHSISGQILFIRLGAVSISTRQRASDSKDRLSKADLSGRSFQARKETVQKTMHKVRRGESLRTKQSTPLANDKAAHSNEWTPGISPTIRVRDHGTHELLWGAQKLPENGI